jgi:hypothetical protein
MPSRYIDLQSDGIQSCVLFVVAVESVAFAKNREFALLRQKVAY